MPEAPDEILDYAAWSGKLEAMAPSYAEAWPFPHAVLSGLLHPDVAAALEGHFPDPEGGGWTHYAHVNERKLGRSQRSGIPPAILRVIDELNGERFLALLRLLTGIEGLIPDRDFRAGGGLSQCGRGGYLNVHTDFTVHPYHPTWRRRLNLIFYVNRHWDDRWGGHTELWDAQMRGAAVRVAPLVNTCLVFDSDGPSYHGHPEPIACPQGVARKTLALYYFTEERDPPVRATRYRPRPSDGLAKRALIALDQLLLAAYHELKCRLGISDALASRVLQVLSKLGGWRRGT